MSTAAAPLAGFRNEDPGPDPIPAAPAAPAKPEAHVSREELEAVRRDNEELRTSNRQLMDLVGRAAPAPAAPAKPKAGNEDASDIDWGEDEPDADTDPNADEDPAILVDEISKHGIAALAKRGFVKKSDVVKIAREESRKAAATASRQVVQRARSEATSESSIMQDFPELADQNSELFKATIPHVQRAARLNPKAANDPATLYLAATAARAQLDAKRGNRDDSDEPAPAPRRAGRREIDEPDDRSDRDIRIASQAGDRGRTRSRIETGGDDFVMSDDARSVARAMGITDDEFKAEAQRIRPAATRRGR